MPAPEHSRWSPEQTVAFWLFVLEDEKPRVSVLATFLEQEHYNSPSLKQPDHIRQKTHQMKRKPYWEDGHWNKPAIEEELEVHKMFVSDL